MNRYGFLPVSVVLLSLVWSESNSFAEEGFFLSADLPALHRPEPELLSQALKSSFKVKIGQNAVSECSAQFISNDGHILTALHCMDPSSTAWSLIEMRPRKVEGVRWTEVGKPNPVDAYLPRIAFTSESTGAFRGSAQLVLAGIGFTGGFPAYTLGSGWDTTAPTRAQVAIHSEDFLILKLNLAPGVRTTCVPLARNPVVAGTEVWTVGWPNLATRANGQHSDGVQQYVTYGRSFASFAETPLLQEQGIPADAIAEYDQMLLPRTRFLHNADAWVGNSGGMVINREGELVGTIARGWETQDRFVDVSTDSVRASRIFEIAQERLGLAAVTWPSLARRSKAP